LQDLSPADRPARRRRFGGRSSLMIWLGDLPGDLNETICQTI
jgi:hypothetical protein